MNTMHENPDAATLFLRCSLAAMLVVVLLCCAANAALAETMKVTATNDIGCTGTITVASTTGATPSAIGPNSNFEFNVTRMSRIVSASIRWNAGASGSMCLAYCQLFVNGVKHTSGYFVIYDWTKAGPQYSFRDIKGSNTGAMTMTCVKDPYMAHLPKQYGEHPLP